MHRLLNARLGSRRVIAAGIIGTALLATIAVSCGDDAEEVQDRNRDTAWIDTTDPLTGTRLSCFYVDGSNSATMHCLVVP
jgi:hypothetical protein